MNTENTEVEIDMDAATSEISNSLFGQEGEGTEVEIDPVPPEGEQKPETPPAETETETPPAETSEEVQALGAPKTWTKDALAEWAQIPSRVQQEILKREDDFFRGIEQYREKADLGAQYDKIFEPYRSMLAAENVDPVQLASSFAGNHYLLSRGTPEQKLEIAANLMSHYHIDVTDLVARMGSVPQKSPDVIALEQKLQGFEQAFNQQQQSALESQREKYNQEVAAFEADEKNIYFQDVVKDMIPLLKTGAASSLQQAYEMAIWNNPDIRQKEFDRMTAERGANLASEQEKKLQKVQKATAADVKTSAKDKGGTAPVGSMEDTLNEAYAKIVGRG